MKKYIKILIILISIVSTIFIVFVFIKSKNKDVPIPTSTPSSSPTPIPVLDSQLPDDEKYSQAITEIHEEYPWYSEMPIEKEKYTIVFDFQKKSFRIRLLLSSPLESLIKSLTIEAINDLREIGVKEPVNYYVIDLDGNQL